MTSPTLLHWWMPQFDWSGDVIDTPSLVDAAICVGPRHSAIGGCRNLIGPVTSQTLFIGGCKFSILIGPVTSQTLFICGCKFSILIGPVTSQTLFHGWMKMEQFNWSGDAIDTPLLANAQPIGTYCWATIPRRNHCHLPIGQCSANRNFLLDNSS